MKSKTKQTVLGIALGLVIAAVMLLPVFTAKAQNAYYSPQTIAQAGVGSWSNAFNAQTSATAFNGQTNRTRVDISGLGASGKPTVSLFFKGNVTASTATTNIAIRFGSSFESLTNGFGGVQSNTPIFWTWTIPTVASANPQTVVAVTNINFDAVGPVPQLYVDSLWFGYCDGYLTNWSLKMNGR